ncbi:transporter substrate-binding domain-containing protein [Jeotgalibaca sp. MA1X17-3]|uniref:transporter substrate-binding domain-containing protein n=1 Tax=Jeotgalibaca sp. MA1X17-3 TaxID=2908211 RepID=UPI001F42983B|nr:transporter substrate-binding domain-containing protein [Jeotgalibaca sp. MA1X17-3]UJF16365.1 transporter substrate-binding domain-containing protein [Jeotgalibaca sp. MA1X17-3]
MKKNWLKGILGTMSILALAACGGETGTSDSSEGMGSANSESEVVLTDDSKLADIQEKGELVMATTADYPPYEWHLVKDGKDEIVGFEIDIAKAIAEEIGVELVIKDMDFDGLIPALTTGKVDIVLAGMNPTPKRAESVDFTDVYISQKDVVLIRKEDADKYTSKESLTDAKWATQKSTIQEDFIKEEFADSYLQSVGKWGTAILSLNTKKVDAILMVDNTAGRYADENENLMIAELDIESSPNEAAVAVAKDNGSLLAKVNEIIDEMKASGDIDQLISDNVQLMEENTIE